MSVVNGCLGKVNPPTGPKEERRKICNDEAMEAILSGISSDVFSQVDRCRSPKSLWEILKKLYGNEPCSAKLVCGNKKRNEAHVFADDEGRSISNNKNDEEETHLFMDQELEEERHT